jgi:serralysin
MAHHHRPEPNIAEVVVDVSGGQCFDRNADDFDILREALTATDLLEGVAETETDLTVFAPTDAAFGELALTLGYGGDTTREKAVFTFLTEATEFESATEPGLLADVLRYHVSPAAKTVAELQHAVTIETLANVTITVDGNTLIDQDPDVEDPEFVDGQTDIEAANGTIQVIDRVLLPVDLDADEAVAEPTIAEVMIATSGTSESNHNFDDLDIILHESLTATDLSGAIADTFGSEGDIDIDFDNPPGNIALVVGAGDSIALLAATTGGSSVSSATAITGNLLSSVATAAEGENTLTTALAIPGFALGVAFTDDFGV